MSEQGLLFRGVYEYDDPAGCMLAVKMPPFGTADLYSGTRILVRPNQSAAFIYNGKITELFSAGNHEVLTENFPLLTRLANWKFGFESPLRCEIWFFSMAMFTARRWGTVNPVMHHMPSIGSMPIRAYGNCNVRIKDPKSIYLNLVGSRSSLDVSEIDAFVQGQILEVLPNALKLIEEPKDLNRKQDAVSEKLESLVNEKLRKYGLEVLETQVASLLPPQEVIKALDEKLAMDIIGNKKEYLLYKVANSLDDLSESTGAPKDPMQVMMGLMMSKGLMGADYHEKEMNASPLLQVTCPACGKSADPEAVFCGKCGSKLKP